MATSQGWKILSCTVGRPTVQLKQEKSLDYSNYRRSSTSLNGFSLNISESINSWWRSTRGTRRKSNSMRRIRSPSGNSSTSSRSKAGNISNSRSKNGNHRNSSCSRKSKEISKWKDNDEIIFHVTNDIKSCRCTSSSLGVTAKAGASNSLTGKKIEDCSETMYPLETECLTSPLRD